MRSIFYLVLVDLKLIFKNIFFWVLSGVLIAIILTVNFLLPRKITITSPDIVTYGFETAEYQCANSIEQLKEILKKDKNMVGVIRENGEYTILANNLSEKQAVAVTLPFLTPKEKAMEIQFSQTSKTMTPPPFNKRCLPVFICFEAVVQGFLLAGVLMLNEKSGKIVRALRVSPINAIHYWIAKILFSSLIGSMYALLMALFTVGLSFSVISFILVSVVASALFTMLGMITAVFFRSINNWFMLASLILGINMLTMFAYIFPTLTLPFMKAIPSYPFIFIYEQILFGSFGLTFDAVAIAVWLFVLCITSIICIKNFFLQPQKGV
ncbi:hypothetical protein V6C42_07245 [Pseudoclostridium thermosuccinogenes]|uniref:hypothetical protein n=1 Tax=Clostridium thermosuccinogenes TaxID=84032 RepID=UPI002FD96910